MTGSSVRRAVAPGDGREFVYRPFLESVISHGTPPMPVIRDILFAESAGLGVDRQPQ